MPWIARKIVGLICKNVAHGAKAPVMLATDPALTDASGRYWKEMTEKSPSYEALDSAVGKRLWEESARLCGLV